MNRLSKTFLTALTAGLMLAGGHVHAQQPGANLSADEVKAWFENAEQELTKAVHAADYARLLDWTKANFADEATVFMSQESFMGDERKSFTVLSADKDDMLKLGQLVLGGAGMAGMTIKDYKLDFEVIEVHPIGPNAATVRARMTESGSFARSPDASAGKPDARAAPSEPVTFAARAECSHLIRRGAAAGQLLIGLTACEGQSRF